MIGYNKIKGVILVIFVVLVIISVTDMIYFYREQQIRYIIFGIVSIGMLSSAYYYINILCKTYEEENKNNLKRVSDAIKGLYDDNFSERIENLASKKAFLGISEDMNIAKNKIDFERNIQKIVKEILVLAANNKELELFLEKAMPKIMSSVNGCCSVFYLLNKSTNKLEIKHSAGFGKSIYSQFDISIGEGFLGQIVLGSEIKIIKNIDDDSIYVMRSFLGNIKPKNIIVAPIVNFEENNEILGVFAVGSIYEYTKIHEEIIANIRRYIVYAVLNGVYYNKNQRLTNELKFQNQLIQNLNEDLESKIKERTVFLNNIINSIKDYAIISLDVNKRVIIFNDGAEKMFGVLSDDIKGHYIKELKGLKSCVERDIFDYLDTAVKNGKASDVCEITTDDGKTMFTTIEVFVVYNEIKNVTGFTIVLNDGSDRRKLKISADIEHQMSEIMIQESAKAIIVIMDDYTIEGISKNAEYVLGISNAEAVGKFIWEIFKEQDSLRSFIEKAFEGKVSDEDYINVLCSKMSAMMKVKTIKDYSGATKRVVMYL